MKIQQILVLLLWAFSISLLAQGPEPQQTPDSITDLVPDVTAEPAKAYKPPQAPEPQQTPDVITDLVPDEDAIPAQVYKPPVAPEPMPPREKALFQSAHDGNLADVQIQVAKGASVTFADKEQRTAFILAANNGHTAVVEFLYGKGAEINAIDHGGMSALMYTAKRSFNETAAFLLNNGAEVNVRSRKKGLTALMLASGWGNEALVQMLLDKGADPAIRDNFGKTAANYAEKRGHSTVANMLSNPPAPE